MGRLTIRYDDNEAKQLEQLKGCTRETSASKALLRAAAEYPGMKEDIHRLKQELRDAESKFRQLCDLLREQRQTENEIKELVYADC